MDKLLSQDEIDALLRGISDGKVEKAPEPTKSPGVSLYDLANQDRIIRGRMPTLEIINDNFCRLFRTSLSLSLRRMIDVASKGVQMVKFGEFIRTLPVPSSLHIFKMEPLRGHGILSLDSKLIFMMVDVLFGGTGKTSFRVEGREFTAIESKIIRKVVNMTFVELEKAWNSIFPVSFRHVRTEINPQFVTIVPPSDLVIVIPFELEFDQFTGNITLCLPYTMIEPIKTKLYSGYQSEHLEIDRSWTERFLSGLTKAQVEIVVELARCPILVQDLLNLKVGDVLPLEKDIALPLVARVEGVPKFLGKAGACGENKAFQVEERIQPN